MLFINAYHSSILWFSLLFIGLQNMLPLEILLCSVIPVLRFICIYFLHAELKKNLYLLSSLYCNHELTYFWEGPSQEDDDIQITLFPCCYIYYSIKFWCFHLLKGQSSKKSLNYFLFHLELLWVILEKHILIKKLKKK